MFNTRFPRVIGALVSRHVLSKLLGHAPNAGSTAIEAGYMDSSTPLPTFRAHDTRSSSGHAVPRYTAVRHLKSLRVVRNTDGQSMTSMPLLLLVLLVLCALCSGEGMTAAPRKGSDQAFVTTTDGIPRPSSARTKYRVSMFVGGCSQARLFSSTANRIKIQHHRAFETASIGRRRGRRDRLTVSMVTSARGEARITHEEEEMEAEVEKMELAAEVRERQCCS